MAVVHGVTVFFARPDAMKGSLSKTLLDVRPTCFFSVPRVFEKIEESVRKAMSGMSKTKKKLCQWALKIGFEYTNAKFKNQSKSVLQYWLANRLVLSKMRKQIGLDQTRILYSAAAPINEQTLKLITSMGLPLGEVYGMSESTGPHVFSLPWSHRFTSCGQTVNDYNNTKILPNDQECCVYGRHVFMGFLNSPEKTKEAIDSDGWLHSGDIGKVDTEGFLYITGRIKELVITAGGENIQPVQIEDNIKYQEGIADCVSNCILIGDNRKFLSVLITLKVLEVLFFFSK